MKKLLILLFILPILSFGQIDIVGGQNTTIENFPWQVATWGLQDNGFYEVCGASIINQYWIVTAAHCVYGNAPNTITIMVGSSNNFSNNGIAHSVDEIIIHPNYSNDNEEPELAYMSHDIALVRISEGADFEFNEFVQPIGLMTDDEVVAGVQNEDIIATITGWGQTESGNTAEILQFIELPIVSNETATGLSENNSGFSGNWPSYAIDESMICIQNLDDSGPCFGDSGGPMIVRNNDDTDWLLAGVFTKMGGCGSIEKPSVFIKISYVKDWICDNTGLDNIDCSPILGCTVDSACNYNPDAVQDDGSCAYPGGPCELDNGNTGIYNNLCECIGTISIDQFKNPKTLIKVVDILGRETTNKGFQLEIYDDGSVEKKYLIK